MWIEQNLSWWRGLVWNCELKRYKCKHCIVVVLLKHFSYKGDVAFPYSSPQIMLQHILGQCALRSCRLLCWTGLNWLMGFLGRVIWTIDLISAQTSQEGIECTKTKTLRLFIHFKLGLKKHQVQLQINREYIWPPTTCNDITYHVICQKNVQVNFSWVFWEVFDMAPSSHSTTQAGQEPRKKWAEHSRLTISK